MYKVFFNERIVLLTDDFIRNFQIRHGLFYKYRNVSELKELLDFYWDLRQIESLFVFHHDIEELRERFKSCFQQVYAGGGLVRNSEGKFLIIKRRGKWDLPKGKVNKNETIEDAALREVTEETGLHGISIISPLMSTYHCYYIDDQKILKRTSWYDMLYTGKEVPVPEAEEDITEIKWISKEEIKQLSGNTFPAIMDVLKYSGLV